MPNKQPTSGHIDRLVERLGAAEQRSAALTAELAEARLAQRQLESYADDFRRTYAEARRLLQQMTALYEFSRSIGATIDPSDVLIRTTEGLRRLLPSDGVAIYLLDNDQRAARRQAVAFPDGLAEPPRTAARDRGPLGRCLARGQIVLEGTRQSAVDRRNPAWTLALPLLAGSRQLGALLLVRPGSRRFSEEERHLAEMVASQTAMAVQNARLVATDGLTGLYNRRYFEQALAFECDRARRVGRPLGLLMVDIDHFKRFNERFGHPAGDEVLRMVAATLAGQLRRTDIVARVGGEEFAAILPENDHAAVGLAAERLRRAVERRPPLIHEGHELPGVHVTVGGVSLPGQAVTPRPLIRAADGALRQAKRAGRNRSAIARAAVGDDCA